MKINIVLKDKSGAVKHRGQIDPDDLHESHLISLYGVTYAYEPDAMIMSMNLFVVMYREVPEPVKIDGAFQPRSEGI